MSGEAREAFKVNQCQPDLEALSPLGNSPDRARSTKFRDLGSFSFVKEALGA